MTPAPFPGVRLATFYFLFFAAVGGFLPYWSLYLESLGFEAATIGTLMALMMATRIVAPNLWGWLADRRGRRLGVIRGGALLAVGCFALVPLARDPLPLAMVIVAYSVFWAAVLPQFEAVTLGHLGERSAQYSRIRLWGSVGFVIASAVIGAALDVTGTGALPWMLLVLMAGVALTSFSIGDPPAPSARRSGPQHDGRLPLASMGCLLLSCALMQASHGPYYVFFSIQLADIGYSQGWIGALWALAVVAEVALFAAMPRVLASARARPASLFVACFSLTALRWLLLALGVTLEPVLIVVQLLHAVSFGAYHALAIALLHDLFHGRLQGRGQALYSSLSFGAGGAAGSAAAGWVWAGAGPSVAWFMAAVLAALGGLVALGIRTTGRPGGADRGDAAR